MHKRSCLCRRYGSSWSFKHNEWKDRDSGLSGAFKGTISGIGGMAGAAKRGYRNVKDISS